MRAWTWGWGLPAIAACAPAVAPRPPTTTVSYEVTAPAPGSWTLEVEAHISGAATPRLDDEEAGASLTRVRLVEGGAERDVPRAGEGWWAPSCRGTCTLRYQVDLEALTSNCHHMDCARRVGDAVIGTAAVWMLRPETAGDATFRVHLHGDPARSATGLRPDGQGGYVFRGHELGEASYTAFGALRRARVDVPGGSLDAVLLGPPLAMGDAAALAWIHDAAACVGRLYGTFPASATVFVVPVKGADEVVFGRVLSLAGGSVALYFGADTPAKAARTDWVVVHELSHLGTASFMGEAHWLEEGLATYYEPILRERAGWMREDQLWAHFAGQMPRGEHKDGEPPSLEDRDDIDSTYWGGALFALLADVAIRRASNGARSLDDVMRAVHDRLGDATHATTVPEFLRVADEAAGSTAVSDTYRTFAMGGQAEPVTALLHDLGVVPAPEGAVHLDDSTPLAAVRRGISTGPRH